MEQAERMRCIYLYCKNEQYAEMPAPDLDPAHVSPPKHYWCGKTLDSFGPDGEEACLEGCVPGRACHALSPSVQGSL